MSSDGQAKKQGLGKRIGFGVFSVVAFVVLFVFDTYATAGAQFGMQVLWVAPLVLPMMFTVVYLSSKLGQVSGRGLFHVIRDFYPRWLLWAVLVGVMIGNTIEAAADLGGMAAALGLFLPLPIPWIVAVVAVGLLA